METVIRRAGPPMVGKWALQWRSPSMSAPAFWYFDSEEEAQEARARMLDRGQLRPELQKVMAVYDNGGESIDRYTVLLKDGTTGDQGAYIGMSADPDNLQGFSQYGAGAVPGEHLGKRIDINELPGPVLEHLIRRLG